MKKLLSVAILALSVLLTGGCIKKKESPHYTMTATVAGTAYKAALCIAYSSSGTMEIEAETTTSGSSLTFPYIALWIKGSSFTVGTFQLDSTMLNNYAEYITSLSTIKKAQSGSVTIASASSDLVSGTFSFTCTDGTVVTDGKFIAENL